MIYSAWLLLLPEDTARSDKLAQRRIDDNIAKGRIPRNGMIRSLEKEKVGTRCECAGWLYFHPLCTWHEFREDVRNLPDLDDFIDVKGRSGTGQPMICYAGSNPDWAYLLVWAGDHPKYHIVSWCWGREAMTVPITDPTGQNRPAHFVPWDAPFMKSPGELFEEQRRRRQSAADGAKLWP